MSDSMSTIETLVEKCKAGYPAVYMYSQEEFRSVAELRMVAKEASRNFYVWSFGKGLAKNFGENSEKIEGDTDDPTNVLDWCFKNVKTQSIVMLRNYHHFLENPLVQSKLADLIQAFKLRSSMIIIHSAVMKIPREVEKDVSLLEVKLPDASILTKLIDSIIKATSHAAKMPIDKLRPAEEVQKQLIENALGLTTSEAEGAFSLALVRGHKAKIGWDPKVVMSEKTAALKKTGILQYIEVDESGMNSVGGMANLKSWIARRKKGFTEEARKYGLPAVKGVLMVGIPGTGKSLGARAISSELKLPLLRCDMGALFGGLVGQSEENTRRAIQTAEAISPCIMWLDEIEKGFAGASNGLDSGVGARVLGTFLTWMQEKKSQVFVYATANDVTQLPPELLRKGRFDEIFSVKLPNFNERREILKIHLTKKGRESLIGKIIDIDHFAKESDGFSGAEIESVINDSLWRAFDEDAKDLSTEHLQTEVDSVIPLSRTMGEKIAKMESWCKDRTRSANEEEPAAPSTSMGGRVVSGASA